MNNTDDTPQEVFPQEQATAGEIHSEDTVQGAPAEDDGHEPRFEAFDFEALYDAEIQPRLEELSELCSKHGVPHLFHVTYRGDGDGQFGHSLVANFKRSYSPDRLLVAAETLDNGIAHGQRVAKLVVEDTRRRAGEGHCERGSTEDRLVDVMRMLGKAVVSGGVGLHNSEPPEGYSSEFKVGDKVTLSSDSDRDDRFWIELQRRQAECGYLVVRGFGPDGGLWLGWDSDALSGEDGGNQQRGQLGWHVSPKHVSPYDPS